MRRTEIGRIANDRWATVPVGIAVGGPDFPPDADHAIRGKGDTHLVAMIIRAEWHRVDADDDQRSGMCGIKSVRRGHDSLPEVKSFECRRPFRVGLVADVYRRPEEAAGKHDGINRVPVNAADHLVRAGCEWKKGMKEAPIC